MNGINLSPEQIKIVEQDEEQMLIEGYAGTGKSLTLLYKFINVLVREENKRILFVTYNSTLIDDTRKRLKDCKEYEENKERHIAEIMTFHEMASNILKQIKVIEKGTGKLSIEKIDQNRDMMIRRVAGILAKYTEKTSDIYKSIPQDERLYSTHNMVFVTEEISWIKAMGFTTIEKYLATDRIGRSKSIRLTRNQRKTIFKIFTEYQKEMEGNKYGRSLDLEDYALKILENDYLISDDLKYDYIFVDEVQDLDPMQIMALCKLTKRSIALSGDAKQRIYKKSPIKYEDLGLDIKQKGRRKVLNKNYRSTAQIVNLANELKFIDSENKFIEKQFVKQGERPIIKLTKDSLDTIKYLVREIKKIQKDNPSKTIAIVRREEVRKKTGNKKSTFRLKLEEMLLQSLIDINDYAYKFDSRKERQIFYTNAYDIKGLEFDVVFILDFNKTFYPLKKGLEKIIEKNEGKDEKLINEDVLDFVNTEKKLLYVAMTRAKEKLYLVANNCEKVLHISEFIYDFAFKDYLNIGFTEKEIDNLRYYYYENGRGRLYVEKEKAKENKIINDINFSLEEKEKSEVKTDREVQSLIQSKQIEKTSSDIDEPNKFEIDNKSNETRSIKIKVQIQSEKSEKVKSVNIKTEEIEKTKDVINDIVKPLLSKHKIKFIDNRHKKGALWVIGGLELNMIMRSLGQHGIVFIYKKEGGRATKNQAAWYLKK